MSRRNKHIGSEFRIAEFASPDFKPVRLRRGKLVHVTEDLQQTACDKDVSGATYAVDEAPTCKRCLRVMLDGLN